MLKNDLKKVLNLFMKITCIFHKLPFFKTTDLYTVDTKISKKIRSEISISIEIILNAFTYLTVSFPLKSLF